MIQEKNPSLPPSLLPPHLAKILGLPLPLLSPRLSLRLRRRHPRHFLQPLRALRLGLGPRPALRLPPPYLLFQLRCGVLQFALPFAFFEARAPQVRLEGLEPFFQGALGGGLTVGRVFEPQQGRLKFLCTRIFRSYDTLCLLEREKGTRHWLP